MKTYLHFLLLVILYTAPAAAQELPPFKNHYPYDYNAGNQNWMISQDDAGVMYFANNNGLLVHRGSDWELYETPNESIMRSVQYDSGLIYTGCFMDFGYWQENEFGQLDYTSIVDQLNVGLEEDEQFWNIITTADYILFQSLSNIYAYDRSGNTVERIVSNPGITKFFKVDNAYYYQVIGEGVFQIINKSSKPLALGAYFLTHKVIEMFSHKGVVYLLMEDSTLYRLVDDKITAVNEFQLDGNVNVYNASFLKDQELLILGTISDGVWSVSLDGKVQFQIDRSSGLANNTVLSTFSDKKQNLWLGLDNGISYLNIHSRFTKYVDQIGILGTTYASSYFNDTFYIGTNQGLFYRKSADDKFQRITGTSGQVWSLDVIDDQLFCSHDGGLFLIEDDRAQRITNLRGIWFVKPLDDSNGDLLMGSYNGLYILHKNNDLWELQLKIDGFNLSSKDVVIKGNMLYVNHEYRGLYALTLNENKSAIIESKIFEDIPTSNTSDIIEFKNDIVFTNKDGVFCLKKGQTEFVKHPELSALFADAEFVSGKMVVTSDDYLWMFTNHYIIRISKEGIDGTYRIEKIAVSADVRNQMTGYENISMVNQQDYLVGTSFGYMTLKTNVSEVSFDHNVQIYEVNQQVNENTNRLPLKGAIDIPNKHSLFLNYSSTSYKALHPTEFQYRLGDDLVWSPWSTNSKTFFKNLTYGDYDFQVRSRVNNKLSNNTASFKFTVQRPVYLSTVALIGYVIMLFILGFVINYTYNWYYNRQNQLALKRQQKELQVVNLKNENELIQLRNDKLRADVEHRSKELAVATMGTIRKNELLNEVSEIVSDLPESTGAKALKKLVKKNMTSKQDWISFEEAFNNADKDFFKKIKERHPNLTTGDLRLCVYLRLNLSSKEIAPLLHISPRSVEIKRYRLRKKMDLDKETNLNDYIIQL
jgi:ligand-binding sensor domain-containing protein/DNA-binding CsgD family transcriptional regulator